MRAHDAHCFELVQRLGRAAEQQRDADCRSVQERAALTASTAGGGRRSARAGQEQLEENVHAREQQLALPAHPRLRERPLRLVAAVRVRARRPAESARPMADDCDERVGRDERAERVAGQARRRAAATAAALVAQLRALGDHGAQVARRDRKLRANVLGRGAQRARPEGEHRTRESARPDGSGLRHCAVRVRRLPLEEALRAIDVRLGLAER